MGFDFLIVGPSRLAPTVVTQSVRFHGGGALIRCNKLHREVRAPLLLWWCIQRTECGMGQVIITS